MRNDALPGVGRGDRFSVLNRGQTLGAADKGHIDAAELQDLMAGGQEMAQLEGSLGGQSDGQIA